MSLLPPQRPQLGQKPLRAPTGDDKRSRRNWLLVALLLLLLVPLCLCIAGQAALSTVGMNEADEDVLSRLAANYGTWEPESFYPLRPELIGTIRAEQATFAANPPLLGTIVPLLPIPGSTQIAFVSATPTSTITPSPTVSPTVTSSPTQGIIFFPFTNTPSPLVPTATFTVLPPATDTPGPPPPSGANLRIIKTDSADPITRSASLTYTLRVSNQGPNASAAITVTDTLPAGVPFISAAGTGWTCNYVNPVVTCTRAGLAAGAVAPDILIDVTTPAVVGQISNQATVSSPTLDPNPGNNSTIETTMVAAIADLSVSITPADGTNIQTGTGFDYVVTITNNGPDAANNVVVTNDLVANATGVSLTATTPNPACPSTTGGLSTTPTNVICNFASIPASGSVLITFSITTTSPNLGFVNLTSVASADEYDPSPGNADTSTVNILSNDLEVAVEDFPDGPLPSGSSFAYTITVTNHGPSTATGVTIGVNMLVSGTADGDVTSVASSQGSCSNPGLPFNMPAGPFSCSLGTIASGASVTITINVTSTAGGGDLSCSATLTAGEVGPDVFLNSDVEPKTITP